MQHQLTFQIAFLLITLLPTKSADAREAPPKVDTTEFVQINGIKQFISIKSNTPNGPLLLFLHGGPGQSFMEKASAFSSELENHFIVVQWDQRETGKTLEANEAPKPISFDDMKIDTEQLVELLLRKFNREKLLLVGHSWGSVLGFHMAENYPGLLHAFIAVSPPVNGLKSDQIALEKLLGYFEKAGNKKAVEQLKEVRIPHENLKQKITQYRWQTEYAGEKVTDEQVEKAMPFFQYWDRTWSTVANEISGFNYAEKLPSLNCPVYFFAGRNDYQSNSSITEEYFQKLKAPQKEFFWFEQSGHNTTTSEPVRMQEIIIKEILPVL